MEDALLLARAQFGINIGFHILFPSLTIALAWFLVGFRIAYERTRDPQWLATYKLWVKIFALTFAMGVVTGVVMSFQFGTNWPHYMTTVGAIAGPLLAYEVLTAFFLEATFLGVMLFGMDRVPGWAHIGASILVALGTTVSAFWILALNSWMQTPTGHIMRAGQAIPHEWLKVIFNPSFPYRLTHMLIASGLTAAFVIAGLSAWRLLRAGDDRMALRTLRTALKVAAVLIPIQIFVGDQHGLNTLHHQPAKIAALEAIWHTEAPAPLTLFAIPDPENHRNDYVISIPYAGSLILTHSLGGAIRGLDEFGEDHAPVAAPFFAFRGMVGIGLLMLAVSWGGVWLLRHGRTPRRWMLWLLSAMTFSGWGAVVCGWIVTEVGRQPWLVHGILRTADAAGDITGAQLGASLTLYIFTYAAMFLAYMVVLTHIASSGSGTAAPTFERTAGVAHGD